MHPNLFLAIWGATRQGSPTRNYLVLIFRVKFLQLSLLWRCKPAKQVLLLAESIGSALIAQT